MEEKNYVPIITLSNEVEALSIQQYLKEAGIPSILRKFSIPAFDPSFFGEGAIGIGPLLEGRWGELLVPEDRAEEAIKIIEELRKDLGI
ncbi:MAG: DUF2007 domain-containing protein [Actinobacteria bacterium]|nr:DUF2007 domain-containing protein [Actinomycetota bacterium]